MVEQKIVAATGMAVTGSNLKKAGLSKAIESAMSQAILDCAANGITEPDQIRAAMQAARKKVVEEANRPPSG